MSIAVLAYSLLPLLGAYSLETLPPMVYVAKSFVQYAALQAVIWLILRRLARRSSSNKAPSPHAPPGFHWKVFASGVLFAVSYTSLVSSFLLIDKAGASVLYESWPLFVTIGLPIMAHERFSALSGREVACMAIAFLGVAVIIAATAGGNNSPTNGPISLGNLSLGYALAITSALAMAGAVLLKTTLLEMRDFDWGLITFIVRIESLHRLVGAGVLLGFAIVIYDLPLRVWFQFDVSTAFALAELVGASAFWFAIASTRRSIISLLWYFVPLLAVVWLYLLGLAELRTMVVIGALLVISANLAAHTRKKHGKQPPHGI